MRLKKTLNRKVEGKSYWRWVADIPPALIDRLGWGEGDELEPVVRGDSLVLRRAR